MNVKMKKRKMKIQFMQSNFICFALLISLIQFNCQNDKPQQTTSQVLNTYLANEPLTMDPHRAWDYASGEVITQIYEGLVEYSPLENKIIPALATN